MTIFEMRLSLILLLSLAISFTAAVVSSAVKPASIMDFDEEDEPVISSSYILPNQIFNDGKPYYASKDPISGQLDFTAKKVANVEGITNEIIEPNEKVIIGGSTPNIHDYLNLPVKYSSSKFVYPLVSSSYANLKYQGSNKNFITNKKPYTQAAQVTTLNHYHTIATTKLEPISSSNTNRDKSPVEKSPISSTTKPVTKVTFSTASSSNTATRVGTTTTTTTVPSSSTSEISITTKKSNTTYSTKTPPPPSTTIITSTRKPQTLATTTTAKTTITTKAKPIETSTTIVTTRTTTPAPIMKTTTTTRKKFIPTKKPAATSTTIESFTPTEKPSTLSVATITATWAPPKQSSKYAAMTTPSIAQTAAPTTPRPRPQPITFTEDEKYTPHFSPLPNLANLNPADIYHTLEQKHTNMENKNKPSMSITDIFNSLVEEESAVMVNNMGNQGIDAQGNLMVPFSPLKPEPFAMHEQQPRPSFDITTPNQSSQKPSNHFQDPTSSTILTTPAPFSAPMDKYNNNEYVSYQVQQPNIMQYRPVPGTINNVVISPGQQSATFVLGSQQKVGTNAFGAVEKDVAYSKNPTVQYGTVINEDISSVNREQLSEQKVPSNATNLSNSKYSHTATNFAMENSPHDITNPQPAYSELIPFPPSPYQQLPLLGSTNRKKLTQSHLQFPKEQNVDDSTAISSSADTKELLVSTNIRFPSSEDHSNNEMQSMSASGKPSAPPQINGHAQPLSLQQIQQSNPVAFPKNELKDKNNPPNFGKVTLDETQLQKHDVFLMGQHQQSLGSSPAQHMIPPPRFPPSITKGSPDLDPQKLYRPTHGTSPYTYNDYTRKPIPGITRPNPDRYLPNILPQFRPNAKLSTGHGSSNFNQEPGNIRVTGPAPQKRPPPGLGNPQFSHRRQPLGQQKQYPLNKMNNYPSGPPLTHLSDSLHRRVYRLSPHNVQFVERIHPKHRHHMSHPYNPLKPKDMERHVVPPSLETLAAIAEEDLVVNDLSHPSIVPAKEYSRLDTTKLEPVVTLQMLQTHKKPITTANIEHKTQENIPVPSIDTKDRTNGSTTSPNIADKPIYESSSDVYVVYPVKGSNELKDQLVTAESQNAFPAIVHVEGPTAGDYTNTQFSVLRDRQQEPVLKHKKAQSLQQETKQQQQLKQSFIKKNSFPYVIEKPNPSYMELHNNRTNSGGIFIQPKIVNALYGGLTETPIAIAFTPTETAKIYTADHYANINIGTPHIKDMRPNTQTEQPLNSHDFDLRAQNYEKNFMAPFYPSLSLSPVTNSPSSGWNILPSTTKRNFHEKNNIDRSDNVKNIFAERLSTASFEIDKFQPELQGGFKPIYPPDYKFESEEEEQKYRRRQEQEKSPQTFTTSTTESSMLPYETHAILNNSISSNATNITHKLYSTDTNEGTYTKTSTQPDTVSMTSTTEKPKRSKFETSLAALLFGDDDEEDDEELKTIEESEARQEPTKAMLSGPRSIPPIGPRSLKI